MNDSDWSKKIAVLIVGALVDAEIVSKSEVSRAANIAAEEIRIRLSMNDRPSLMDDSHT
jgi:hypothetical protein